MQLRYSDISTGDILLEKYTPNSILGLLVKLVTPQYIHAAICVESDIFSGVTIIESGIEGIKQNIVNRKRKNIFDVYRVHCLDSIKFKAVRNAQALVGNPYNYRGLLELYRNALTRTSLKHEFVELEKFCSQLVAHCYAQAGLDLLPDTLDMYTTPFLLSKSPYVKKIGTLKTY